MSKTVASSNQHVDSLLAGTGKHMKAMAMTLAQHCSGSSSKAAGAWGFQAGPHLTGMLPCRRPPLLPPQPRPPACAAARPAPASGGNLCVQLRSMDRATQVVACRNTCPPVPQQRAQPATALRPNSSRQLHLAHAQHAPAAAQTLGRRGGGHERSAHAPCLGRRKEAGTPEAADYAPASAPAAGQHQAQEQQAGARHTSCSERILSQAPTGCSLPARAHRAPPDAR